MASGNIYFHSRFRFHDGQSGEKLFVVLNNPSSNENEPYLVAKTTTNKRNRGYKVGCNPEYGDFLISSDTKASFPEDTIIQLLDIYEFSANEFLKGSLDDRTITHKGALPLSIMSQIVNCVKRLKEDISEKHFAMITRRG